MKKREVVLLILFACGWFPSLSNGAELPELKSTKSTLPAEKYACTDALITNDDQQSAETALAAAEQDLLKAAREAEIPRVGAAFVFGPEPGQTKDVYPLRLIYCMSVDTMPSSTVLFYRKMPEHNVTLLYCASPQRELCQEALQKDLHFAHDGATLADAPQIRTGIWMKDQSPSDSDMVVAVTGKQNTFDLPVDNNPADGDVRQTIGGRTPRPLGQFGGQSGQAEPPPREAAALKGFVFAVSEARASRRDKD